MKEQDKIQKNHKDLSKNSKVHKKIQVLKILHFFLKQRILLITSSLIPL